MTDLALQQFDDGTYDIALFEGDLVRDDSLRSALFVSLFSDAEDPDAVDGDRRGWWGDALSPIPGDRIGSLLWKLERVNVIPEVINQAQSYMQSALAWIVTTGVASKVTVTAFRNGDDEIDADIVLEQPSGPQRIRLSELWAANFGSPFDAPNAIAGGFADASSLLGGIYQNQFPVGDLNV